MTQKEFVKKERHKTKLFMSTWMQQFNNSIENLVNKLEGWLNAIIVALPNFILAAVVLVSGIFLSRFINKYVTKLFQRFSKQDSVIRLLSTLVTTLFMLITIFIVLSILQLDTALKSLLAGAGVVGLAIGLALQEPIVNLFSGVMMSAKKFYRIGDLIETDSFFGVIKTINLRSTIIRTISGQEVIIPNKSVYHNPLTNYTTSRERRVDLNCGVSYGDDLEKVRDITVQTIKEQVEINPQKPIAFYYTEFGSSSINFVVQFWISDFSQSAYLKAQSDAIIAIKRAFDDKDIAIPFPIRTLDFGVKGGQSLQSIMPEVLNREAVTGN